MNASEEQNMIKVATLYYKEGLTQAQIAKKFGVSRSLISKWLITARKKGYIEIFFNSEAVYSVDLAIKLEKLFGLKSAVIVDTRNLSTAEVEKVFGQTAALTIRDMLSKVHSIGVSWGNSIKNLVTQFPFENYPDKVFIPLIGGMGTDHFDIHSNQLCYEFARKTRSSAKYLYAPALVSNSVIRQELENNDYIKSILNEAKNVDLAIVSISSPFRLNTMEKIGYISKEETDELRELGVVGDINSRFFNKEGKEINHDINNNVIGISIDDLKNIPNVVTIAHHKNKWLGIYYACQNKITTDLITTDIIASKLISEYQKNRR